MRNWIYLIENPPTLLDGEVVSLSQHKTNKNFGDYVDAVQQIYKGEADFFTEGKFLPFSKAYIDSGYDPDYAPVFSLDVSFRDEKRTPRAREVLATMTGKSWDIQRTKYEASYPKEHRSGPYAVKQISFEEARTIWNSRDHSPYGAYQPSKSGFRSARIDNYDKDGMGFCLMVGGKDYRRSGKYASEPHREEYHIIDNQKDWQEVADMMASIVRARTVRIAESGRARAMTTTDYGYWITDAGEKFRVDANEGHQKVAEANGISFGHAMENGWIRIVVSDDNSLHVHYMGARVGSRAIATLRTVARSSHFPKIYVDVGGSMYRSEVFDNSSELLRFVNRTSKAAVAQYTNTDWDWANSR